mmetsp:Transcript_15787/g.29316  ORF Transcript_15787/g.29316 Transcript_15787/m.29316 type:complete len:371 (+) Transcript_15787:114-1226(+)
MTSNGGPLNASSFVLDPQHRSALQARILFCPAEERTARELQQLPKEQREQVWADMTGHPETQQYRMTAESPALVQQQVNAMTEDIQSLLSSSTSSSVSTSSSEGEASHPSNDNSNNSHDATTTLSSISTSSFQAYRLARQRNPEYVEAQKIMFLRAEDFNAKAAAVRMLHFFDTLQSLRLPLGRDIRLSDLDVDDKESLEAGGMQWLPVTDHAGRAIVVTRQANYKYKTHDNMVGCLEDWCPFSFSSFVAFLILTGGVFCLAPSHVLHGTTHPKIQRKLPKTRHHFCLVSSRSQVSGRVRLRTDTQSLDVGTSLAHEICRHLLVLFLHTLETSGGFDFPFGQSLFESTVEECTRVPSRMFISTHVVGHSS